MNPGTFIVYHEHEVHYYIFSLFVYKAARSADGKGEAYIVPSKGIN